jgi:hypothetical protein
MFAHQTWMTAFTTEILLAKLNCAYDVRQLKKPLSCSLVGGTNVFENCRGPPAGHIRAAVCTLRSPDFTSPDFVLWAGYVKDAL